MRSLVLPAALALAFALYLSLPQAAVLLRRLLLRLHARVRVAFTDRRGRTDERSALAVFALLLSGVSAVIAALHPVAAVLTAAPLFTALASVPKAAAVKRDLDSGSHVGDIAAYESIVSETCARLAPAFAAEAFAPLLLCALGLALSLGGALGWAALGLRAVSSENSYARRILAPLDLAGDRALHALMLICSCLVGRNPLRTKGADARARLLSVLGIAEDDTRAHPPMAGDIAQAAFLCCFCLCLLCAALALALLPLR